jgi:hypothetical protein
VGHQHAPEPRTLGGQDEAAEQGQSGQGHRRRDFGVIEDDQDTPRR